MQGIHCNTARVGNTVHSFLVRYIYRSYRFVCTLGASPRSTQQVCLASDEHVDAAWGQDGSHHSTRVLRLVGVQRTWLLSPAVLSGGAAAEPLADRSAISACGNFGNTTSLIVCDNC